MRKYIYYIPIVCVVFVILLFISIIGRPVSVKKSVVIVAKLPNIDLNNLKGYSHFKNSDLYRPNFKAVNIFASWCQPCKAEHNTIFQLSKHMPVYGINWRDTEKDALQYLQEMGNVYKKIATDKQGYELQKWGIIGIPETLIINPMGKVIFHYKGAITLQILEAEIIPVLRKNQLGNKVGNNPKNHNANTLKKGMENIVKGSH